MELFPNKLADLEEFICADASFIASRIRQTSLGRLLQDWQARCTDAQLPARNQFTPEQLRYILGNLILWDVQREPPVATYRLYGSNFAIHRSGELTGKRLDQLPDPVMRTMALHGLRRILVERKPLLTRGRYALNGGTVVAMETLSLPLASDGSSIDMILHGQFNETLGYDERRSGPGTGGVTTQCEPADLLQVRIEDSRLKRLLQEWNAWRGDRRLPSRADFSPEMLDYLLGNLFLFDIHSAKPGSLPRFRYRLFGSTIAAFRGFDLTGRFVDEHPDGAFGARAQLAYSQAVARRMPLWAKVDMIGSGGLVSRFEGLALPLASDGEMPDMMLGAQIMTGA